MTKETLEGQKDSGWARKSLKVQEVFGDPGSFWSSRKSLKVQEISGGPRPLWRNWEFLENQGVSEVLGIPWMPQCLWRNRSFWINRKSLEAQGISEGLRALLVDELKGVGNQALTDMRYTEGFEVSGGPGSLLTARKLNSTRKAKRVREFLENQRISGVQGSLWMSTESVEGHEVSAGQGFF